MSPSPATDTRDRVIRLEAKVQHMEEKLDTVATQVAEVHALLQQARGARWLLVGVAMAIGAVGGFFASVAKLFGTAVR